MGFAIGVVAQNTALAIRSSHNQSFPSNKHDKERLRRQTRDVVLHHLLHLLHGRFVAVRVLKHEPFLEDALDLVHVDLEFDHALEQRSHEVEVSELGLLVHVHVPEVESLGAAC